MGLLAAPVAQAEFQNGSFEADLNSWNVTHWTNPRAIPSFPPRTLVDLGLTADSTNRWDTTIGYGKVLTEAVGSGSDVHVNGNVRYPLYGSKAARINYRGDQNRASSIGQTATMTVGDIDPADGKVHVRFAIAPVLENPTHAPEAQPYFFVEVRNVTKGTQLFQTFNFSNQSGVPWQSVGSYQYTNWQAIDVGPGPGVLDVGDVVEVIVVASGCGPSGHEGHVYMDSGQGLTTLPGPFVTATGPQYAVAAGSITYNYRYNNGGSAPMPDTVVTIVSPQDNTAPAASRQNLRVNQATLPAACTVATAGTVDTVTCNVGTLNPGSTGDLQLTWTVPAAPTGPINHGNYTIESANSPPLLGPLVPTQITTSALADLKVSVTDGKSSVRWGDTTTYTVEIVNDGPNDVPAGMVITNAVPSSLKNVSWTCVASGAAVCPALNGTGSIAGTSPAVWPAGGKLAYTVAAQADPSGSGTANINYPVSVSLPGGATLDSDSSNNTYADVNSVGSSLQTLTLNRLGTGTVTSVAAGIQCSSSTACNTQSASFPDGSTVVLYATAPAGSIFAGWSGGVCSGTTPSCTVQMSQARSVTATFAVPKNVSITTGPGGTVTPAAGTNVPVATGTTTSLSVVPNAGYAPVIAGTCPSGSYAGTTYTTGAIMGDCTVDVTFTNTGVVTATPNSPANGSVIGGAKTVTSGGSATWQVVPNSGFAPTTPTHTCAPGVGAWNAGRTQYTVNPISASCNVTFGFAAGHTVTASVSGGSRGPGSITAGSIQNVVDNDSAVFVLSRTATVDPASTCAAGTFDASGTTYTVANVTTGCAVLFNFAALAPSAVSHSIPTLNEWGLMILSVLLGLTMLAMRGRVKL